MISVISDWNITTSCEIEGAVDNHFFASRFAEGFGPFEFARVALHFELREGLSVMVWVMFIEKGAVHSYGIYYGRSGRVEHHCGRRLCLYWDSRAANRNNMSRSFISISLTFFTK